MGGAACMVSAWSEHGGSFQWFPKHVLLIDCPHPEILRAYSRLYAQGSFLECLGVGRNHLVCLV